MSEPIPESIPTSAYRRPAKRARTTDPASQQSSQIEALFANPERNLEIPTGEVIRGVAAPPEIVQNVQGSSAGAGSGEFHVYKASRRREYERLRIMDEETEKEQADQAWKELQEERKAKDDAKLSKNRARREKMKARQAKAKEGTPDIENGIGEGVPTLKKKLGSAKIVAPTNSDTKDVQMPMADGPAIEEEGITILEDG